MSEIAEKVKAIIVDKLGVEESEVVTDARLWNLKKSSISAFQTIRLKRFKLLEKQFVTSKKTRSKPCNSGELL